MPDQEPTSGPTSGPTTGPAKAPSARATPKPTADPTPGRWGDLGTRVASAIVMLALIAAALWAGGIAWTLVVMAVAAVMGWELARLCAPGIAPSQSVPLALTFVVPIAFLAIPFLAGREMETIRLFQYLSWPLMLLSPLLGLVLLRDGKLIWIGYGFVIQFGAQYFLFTGLDRWSLDWLFAVVGIVMISDILGYFAGRLIGGPKFWPAISPKKTWSGTVAGWIGAALFGAFVLDKADFMGSTLLAALAAAAIALSGQMGDIAASAIKRRVGVKDASNLIPGHGGLMDRLDAMIAAAAATIVWVLVF